INVLARSLDIDYLSYGALLTGLKSASVHDAVAERGYDIQTNFLGIPPHLGFFSQWAPSHTRRVEVSMFVRWAQFFVWALSYALVCRLLGGGTSLLRRQFLRVSSFFKLRKFGYICTVYWKPSL
ncbi:hypothetical protein CPAR01_01296, partial [Colletotrichum paranaense]